MDALSLRARRLALGLSQDELAKKLGILQNTLSRWENGVSAPRDPVSIDMLFDNLEEHFLAIVEDCLSLGEDEEKRPHTLSFTGRVWGRSPLCRLRGLCLVFEFVDCFPDALVVGF